MNITWLRLSSDYFEDDRVADLSEPAQIADLRLMTLANRLESDGRLTVAQITDRLGKRSYNQNLWITQPPGGAAYLP